jgi:hypothetical protein
VDEELQFSLQRTSEIFVVDQKNTKLASAILSVNSHNPNKKRRRLRSAWSLF